MYFRCEGESQSETLILCVNYAQLIAEKDMKSVFFLSLSLSLRTQKNR